MRTIRAWQMVAAGEPLRSTDLPVPALKPTEVLVRIAGCGLCHTDLGFLYHGVRTVKAPPLTLGHEISGIVEDCGSAAASWRGRAVIVPAVLPCGRCELCRKGRGTICREQSMPGNHIDGGFASHIVVECGALCPVDVPDTSTPFGDSGVTLGELSVVADAVTTPYQAVHDSGLARGDLAIVVGVGGIGGFGVQIAKAAGATVVAIDVAPERLALLSRHGADLTLDAGRLDARELRKAVQRFAAERSLPPWEWKIFECSGTTAGQGLAFGLLNHGATLAVVGFTMDRLELRLSNLMAFGARAVGNWGCDPRHYPAALDLVRSGQVQLAPFVERFPLDAINSVLERARRHELSRRAVLVPDGA